MGKSDAGVPKSTIQMSAVVFSPLTVPPPPAPPSSPRPNASDVAPRAGVSYVPFGQEPAQDSSLNEAILALAIGTSIVVVCCAYYTVRFLSVHIKNVALAKQVRSARDDACPGDLRPWACLLPCSLATRLRRKQSSISFSCFLFPCGGC